MDRTLVCLAVLLGMMAVPLMAMGEQKKANVAKEEAPSTEQLLISKLRDMWDGEKAGNLDAVLVNLADDFTELAGDGGLYHKEDVIKSWPDIKLNDYQLGECTFKELVPDAAYLTCRLQIDATFKGKAMPRNFRVTSVWTKQKGEWLIRLYQGTVIPDSSNQ